MLWVFCEWLQHNHFIVAVNQSVPLSVAVEVLHYFSFFVVVGHVGLVDLRLLGLAASSQTPSQLAERMFPWVWRAFALNCLSGFFMFAGDAVQFYTNRVFQVAMAVVLLAAIFTLIIQINAGRWSGPKTPLLGKFAAGISLALWIGSILASVEVPALTNVG